MQCLALLTVLVGSACVSSDSVPCGDGLVCPSGTTCSQLHDPDELVCASAAEIAACAGKAELDECMLDGLDAARCYSGVCLAAGCGNRRIDPDEACDDGNAGAGDGCSADCLSDETCGNGRTDLIRGESCDDGNFVDHDGCTSTCSTEQLVWMQRLTQPPARYGATMAYDALRDRVVLVGGQPTPTIYEWDGVTWERSVGAGPNEALGALAFDGAHIVFYTASAAASATWTYDGSGWAQSLAVGPGPRQRHALAFDSHRRRVVLFGGTTANDTWEWDGTSWQAVPTVHAPPARFDAMLAYDPRAGEMILAGGRASGGTLLGDTWRYDGIDWTEVTPGSGPAPRRAEASMAFDGASQHLIAIGGCEADSCSGGSTTTQLTWDGTMWTETAPAGGPPALGQAAIASTGTRIVLMGGANVLSEPVADVWIYEGGVWREPATPGPRSGMTLAFDQQRHRIVAYGGQDETLAYPADTWELSTQGWTRYASAPSAQSNFTMSYDPITKGVLLFGGLTPSPTADTWLWRDGSWTKLTPALSPSPRLDQASAVVGGHLYIFGGVAPPTGLVNEVWRWDGTTWTQMPDRPAELQSAAIGTDLLRDEIVMQAESGTWTFDGTAYTKRTVSVNPPPHGTHMVWNAARQSLIVATVNDAWEWNGSDWSPLSVASYPPQLASYQLAPSWSETGCLLYGSFVDAFTAAPQGEELWELRWQAPTSPELCDGTDADGDQQIRCDDPDCAWRCESCGDAVCSTGLETCRSCPADCACSPVCGDYVCDAGETACPGDCP